MYGRAGVRPPLPNGHGSPCSCVDSAVAEETRRACEEREQGVPLSDAHSGPCVSAEMQAVGGVALEEGAQTGIEEAMEGLDV